MSDQSPPPPKPKPGSLRDRIAAFEKSASGAAPAAPAPVPRPKPAGFASWKPKPPSPSESPSASAGSNDHGVSPSRAGGMSASDAKESITKAGSLKDRMAALQGKGAFGAPPPVAPKPVLEKPKWKPPPVVQAPADDDDQTGASSTAAIAAAVERTISPPVSVKSGDSIDTPKALEEGGKPAAPTADTEGDDEGPPPEANPEEEERQRRAAIAARMARLGGARVGMAPPVFGKKPPVRRPTQEDAPKLEEPPKYEEPTAKAAKSTEIQSPPTEPIIVASPPTDTTGQEQVETNARQSSAEYFPVRKNSENASILSVESTGSQPTRSPSSMPVPAVPRRSGPPRKKLVKAVPPPPPEVTEEKSEDTVSPPVTSEEAKNDSREATTDAEPAVSEQVLAEKQEEVKELTEESIEPKPLDNVQQETLYEPATEQEMTTVDKEEKKLLTVPSEAESPPHSHATETEEVEEAEDEVEEAEAFATSTSPPPVPPSPPQQAVHDDVERHDHQGHHDIGSVTAAADVPEESDEAEEEARKKRVAERLAKMGGINPFAPPPPQVRSPPQHVQLPPAPPPVEPHKPCSEPSLSHEGPHNAEEEENFIESAAEEEAFDEDEVEEDDILDDQPVVSSNEPERPVTPTLPHSERRRESVDFQSRPPPVPPMGTRPSAHVQQDEEEDDEASDYGDAESEQDQPAPAPPPRPLSIPARPPVVSTPPPESGRGNEAFSPPARPAQPPRRIMPQAPEPAEDDDDDEAEEEIDEEADERLATSQLFVPPPGRGPIAIPRHVQAEAEEDGDGSENDAPALPVPHRRSMEIPPGRPIPPPPPVHGSFEEEDSEPESDHDGQALPIPPRRSSGPTPRVVPLPPPPPLAFASHSPPVLRDIPPAPPQLDDDLSRASPEHLTPTVSISGSEEILDEEEGDPIDPAFHSPSRQTSFASIHAIAQAQAQEGSGDAQATAKSSPPLTQSPPAAPTPAISKISSDEIEQPQEDAEQLRRKTIAERMAKLGGIRFGAAPLPTPASRPPPPVHHQDEQEETENAPAAEEQPAAALSEEEEERARKERIAAKLATMGGMRIGMMPMGIGGLPPQRSHIHRDETSNPPPSSPSAPPVRAVPPARPPPPPAPAQHYPDTDSEYGSAATSDDGVKIEAEESEMEEVGHSDAQEEHEEEAPPPVPSRARHAPSRQVSVDKPTTPISPPIPSPRPPVPTAMPARRSSVQTSRSSTSNSGLDSSIQRKSSTFMPPTQSDYVMVEEPEPQEMPPPPPARPTSRVPPLRSTPQVPPAMTTSRTSDTHEWELPSIPTANLDFGEGADLSLSWTDAGELISPTTSAPPPLPPAKKPSLPPAPPAAERQLSADDLIALWGRVGVQVCEAATTLFEKSKKTLIGDGTYGGFVHSVLAAVPNAASTSESGGYGYLIYAQNGGSVQKRASEIMPGDIVEILDAKFKGHKGLQTYHQNVGGAGGEVLVGVVGEVEAKKSKIRVFQANQHVGQQTVESVSYRLEDLKSGIVKVYRVLDA